MGTVVKRGEKFRAQVRKGGKSISKSFLVEADARKWVRQQEVDIERGVFKTTSAMTIDQAVRRYREIKDESTRPIKKGSTEDYVLAMLEADLKGVTVEGCTPDVLAKWAKKRPTRNGAGPATVNFDLTKLGTVLRTVASIELASFPDVVGNARPLLHHLGLIGASNKRDRRPTDDNITKIKEHCGQWMIDIIDVARIIGLRRGEIVRMLWADIDVPRRLILIRDRKDPKQKIGNNQLVPLLGESFDIVMRQPRESPRIFPHHPISVSRAFLRACRAAGVEDLHFHDLRHDAASNLFEAGWDIPHVAAVTGHKTWSQLKRYTQINPESLHLKRVK